MTARYMNMIERLRDALKAKGGWDKPENWRSDPWGAFYHANPAAMVVVMQVQAAEHYELSWNQCCNAVARYLES